jgi:ferredoxin
MADWPDTLYTNCVHLVQAGRHRIDRPCTPTEEIMSTQNPTSSRRVKIIADRSACCGYGVCAEICPEIYKLDQNGIVVVEDAVVPVELEEKAREGAEACPQSALRAEEVSA